MSDPPPRDPTPPDPTPPDPTPRDRTPSRPLGIELLIWLYWFWAGAIVLLFLGLAIGDGPVMLGGRAASRGEALRSVLPALVPMLLAVVGAAMSLGLGRRWARPAALFPFLLVGFGPALTGIGSGRPVDLAFSLLAVLPVIVLLGWYLYRRPGPRAYFGPPGQGGGA